MLSGVDWEFISHAWELRKSFLPYAEPHWLKLKNPNSDAVRREAEEEWG
jgi:hypothetical protein